MRKFSFFLKITTEAMLDLKKIKEAVDFIAKEQWIPRVDLIDAIESALKIAYKKDYGNKEEVVNVKIDLDTETLEITVEKTLVEEVENSYTEITRDELGDEGDDFEIGDIVELDVTDNLEDDGLDDTFGRIASQAARQIIVQKMSESEKRKIYELFKGKEGTIFPTKVLIIESGKVIMDYNGTQITLPKSEQVSRDRYHQGQRLYLYVEEVSNSEQTGPKVTLTRKAPALVSRLFETQVPEMEDGTVRIENIVRMAGVKTKILVASDFDEIDAAGTLIGPKGLRVRTVMDELNGEKIDIIALTDSMEEMVAKALTPARIEKVVFNEEEGVAHAYILPTERAKALGKNGLNITQASHLLDVEIKVEDLGL